MADEFDCVFFFSSRRRHTRYWRDWSSDVCSSDLGLRALREGTAVSAGVPMRGVAYDRYGGPEVLTLRDDLPDPPVGPDTELVRVHAAGVNPVDVLIRSGGLTGAYPHHLPIVPGWDVAGVVEAAGPAVAASAAGDEVFGYVRRDDVQWGTTAELVPAPQRCLAHKPESLSFAEAAGLPLAGLTAYQSLTEALDVHEGERLLVHRAAGGVGFSAVQIAVALGAHVVGTAG